MSRAEVKVNEVKTDNLERQQQKKTLSLFWLFASDLPVVEFMYPVFTRMPGESYRGRLRSLL